ncbi:uncharacterized protein [Pyrus communis]|uniref:uncharacterized protein n=1 Tax=Pyrus communis TaxID=23211 RepID=UPI0035C1F1E8
MYNSESAVDKVTLTNESKSGEFHSKISKRLEQVGSQMCQPSLIGATYLSCGTKGIDTMRLHRAIEQGVVTNANDAQIGSKLPETPALVDKETKAKHVISGREDFNSDSVPRTAKPVGNSRLSEKEVTEREPVLGSGTRKSLHDLRHVEISSSQANPFSLIEKTIKPSAQTCVNPKSMLSSLESMRNSKIITVEGSKLCPDKPAKKKTKLSTLNISKNIVAVKFHRMLLERPAEISKNLQKLLFQSRFAFMRVVWGASLTALLMTIRPLDLVVLARSM